jgi:hypothetical protein
MKKYLSFVITIWAVVHYIQLLHGPELDKVEKKGPYWKTYLKEQANKAGLDHHVLLAQVYTESEGRNDIKEYSNGRAISFWMCQISIAAAQTYSNNTGVDIGRTRYQIIRWLKKRTNSIDVMVWSMKRYYDIYGDYRAAVTCYNAGHRGYIRHYKHKLGYRKIYVDRLSKFLGHKLTY